MSGRGKRKFFPGMEHYVGVKFRGDPLSWEERNKMLEKRQSSKKKNTGKD